MCPQALVKTGGTAFVPEVTPNALAPGARSTVQRAGKAELRARTEVVVFVCDVRDLGDLLAQPEW
jgi:hypothetical protein